MYAKTNISTPIAPSIKWAFDLRTSTLLPAVKTVATVTYQVPSMNIPRIPIPIRVSREESASMKGHTVPASMP